MYRTTIEAVGGAVLVKREHSTNPKTTPYHVSSVATFGDEHSFRILEASKLTAELTPEGAVQFRQENPDADAQPDLR